MTKKKPLLLITNDDGYKSKGISALIEVAKRHGDVVVVAPEGGRSGMAHAVTLTKPVYLKKISEEDNVQIYAISGSPADCVKMGLHSILKRRPDYIFSGINHGSNASVNLIYSGTMAAAIEGAMSDIPSIGFSVLDYDEDADFEAAMHFADTIIKNFIEDDLPQDTCLNVNFPTAKISEIKGIKVCRQGKARWIEEFVKQTHPHGWNYYWLTGKFVNLEPEVTDTDLWALENNYVSIVPVSFDMTHNTTMQSLKSLYNER